MDSDDGTRGGEGMGSTDRGMGVCLFFLPALYSISSSDERDQRRWYKVK